MYDENSNELGSTFLLLDVFLTIITFMLSFWGRQFITEEGLNF